MTLNYNNMLQTIAQFSHVLNPAQLLPLLIGTLSFVRTLWLIFQEHGKSIKNVLRAEAEMAENEAPKLLHNIHRAFEIIIRKIISPLSVSSDTVSTVQREQSHSNTPHRVKPLHHRYLVAWLPWLSVFKFWKHYCPMEESLPTTSVGTPDREDIKLSVIVREDSTLL